MFSASLLRRSTDFLQKAEKKGAFLATAESCTGGLLSGLWTAVAGSSVAFGGSVEAYHNSWKEYFLGVSPDILEKYGAVSAETAEAMIKGLLRHGGDNPPFAKNRLNITHGVAITGLSGRDTPYALHLEKSDENGHKPDGLVFMAAGNQAGKIVPAKHQFTGDRMSVREQTLLSAMDLIEELWNSED